MIKRICALVLASILLLSSSYNVLACDENQTYIYVSQMLFGTNAPSMNSSENFQMLLDALYLNSMQSNGCGEEKIEHLKRKKVANIGKISDLNIGHQDLMECSHNTWEYQYNEIKKQQNNRKEVLRNTVYKVFDIGFFERIFGDKKKKEKYESFSALLYYTHILSDYLADDPNETRIITKGKEIPSYAGNGSIEIRGNIPAFTKKQLLTRESFYKVSELDSQNRTGVACANIGMDTLNVVGMRKGMVGIKPSGWNQNKYQGVVTSQPPYLFNRCHLIAHQLGGQEEQRNLITGTRYLNEQMIPYENQIRDYIMKTGNHVLYRVTPVYKRGNQLASGVQLEATSVEDSGKGVSFNVFCYNVQPGVDINYMNGKNEIKDIITWNNNSIPFVAKQTSSDLVSEMRNHLEILFVDQKEQNEYEQMMTGINKIVENAKNIEKPNEVAKDYIALRKCEYEYLDILVKYVPKLLRKEKCFKLLFK